MFPFPASCCLAIARILIESPVSVKTTYPLPVLLCNVFPGRAKHPTERNTPHRISTRLNIDSIYTTTMPSKPRRISQKLVEQEGRLQLAISAIEKNEILSIRRAADTFDVPLSTLYGRLNGRQYRIEKRANGYRLSPTQEESLVEWILSRVLRGVPPRPSHV
jgi:predicted HTH domain antitoxin